MSVMQFLASLGQIVFGGSALFIAVLQWKLSKNNSKFQAYEKRYEAYKELKKYLGRLVQEAKVETEDLVAFQWKFEEHYFLFGQEIHEYVKSIYMKSLELRSHDNLLSGFGSLPQGEERNNVINEREKVFDWLLKQIDDNKKLFEEYLRVK